MQLPISLDSIDFLSEMVYSFYLSKKYVALT